MPKKERHLIQATNNEKLAQSLKSGEHKDWAVTVIFYAALHLVEAYFAAVHDWHFTAHSRRDENMSDERNLDAIYEDYRLLEEESKKTRYSCKSYSTEEIDKKLFPLLEKIKNHLAQFVT